MQIHQSSLSRRTPWHLYAGVKVKDPGGRRYRSEINLEWLLACAGEELREDQPTVRSLPAPTALPDTARNDSQVYAYRLCRVRFDEGLQMPAQGAV